MDFATLSASELLRLHAGISEELRARGIVRSANNPVGDLAEYLFCRAFDWSPAGKNARSADAACSNGKLYQIKGRRSTQYNQSRQLGALRDLPSGGFDYLAAILFAEDYSISRAAIIPHALVLEKATYQDWTKSWRFMLRDEVWSWSGVEDVTARIKTVSF
ncbi:hypothetical protein FHS96_002735 [Sphingomonas zeicaulis]|uniref:hypothetical protein n=1 Tax=Sphingomonas zeicaulis TaxID=1632740 RepID=UPI003D25F09F